MSDLDSLRTEVVASEYAGGNLESVIVTEKEVDDGKLFGLSPVERMVLSMGLFMLTLVSSFLLLLASGSIAF